MQSDRKLKKKREREKCERESERSERETLNIY